MLIFLHGPDTFRSRQKLKQIKERFRREVDAAGYNTSRVDGTRFKLEDFERDVLATPFLAAKRMVVVENFFSGKAAGAIEKQVLKVLQRPAAQATVIIFWEGEPPHAGKKPGPLMTFLQASPYAEAFARLTGSQLQTWYRHHAERLGLTLTPPAGQRLTEIVGNDLWRADAELAKLAAYCRGRAATIEDVGRLTVNEVEENVFALTDALGQRRTAEAIWLLEVQRQAGVSALELLSKITWHLRNLLMAKSWIEEHGSRPSSWALASAVGLHPFVAKKTLGQVGNFTLPELQRVYLQLAAIDRRMKTSAAEPQMLLAMLVTRATQR